MSFRTNAIYSVINKLINVGFTFVTLVLIARILEPEGQGKYSLLVQVSRTFFYFFSFGAPVSFVFYFGRRKGEQQALIKTFSLIFSFLALVGLIFGLLFGFVGQEQIFEDIEFPTIAIACLGIPLWFMNSFLNGIFSGLEKFKQMNTIQLVQPLALLALVSIAAMFDFLDVRTAIIINIISMALNFLVNIYVLKKDKFKLGFFQSKCQPELIKASYKYSFKSYLGSVAEFLIYKADIYIIAFFLSNASLGLYVIAVNIVERLWMISESVSKVLFAKLVNVTGEEKRNFFTIYTLQGTFLVSILGALGLGVLGKIFIELVFGQAYSQSVLYLYILLPGVVLQSTALMIKKVLEARGYPGTNAKASMGCLALNIILNFTLIPQYGVPGAAFSTSITYITYFFIQARSLKIKFGIKKRSFMFIDLKDIKFIYESIAKKS